MTSRTDTATADPSLEFGSARRFGWGEALLGFAVTLAALAVLAFGFLFGLGEAFAGRAMPGVTVAGVSIAGLDRPAAEARLREQLGSLSNGRLTLSLDGNETAIPYSNVHRDYDMAAILDEAFAVGRQGSVPAQAIERLASLTRGTVVAPRVRYDVQTVAAVIADAVAQIDRAPVNAEARYRPNPAGFVVTASQDGSRVDNAGAQAAVAEALASTEPGDRTVRLASERSEPAVTTAEALAARDQALAMTTDTLTLVAEDETFSIKSTTVRSWVTFQSTAYGGYRPTLDPAKVSSTLEPLAARVDHLPRNATFTFNGQRATGVTPGRSGLQVSLGGSADRIGLALATLAPGVAPRVDLVMAVTEPTLTTAAARTLQPKLRRLGPGWTTHFPVGIKNFWGRNIAIPTNRINGLVLQPGQWFDFWKAIGSVSVADGFGRGGAIINGHTDPTGALAGGICSCSTTLFNAAMRAGLQMGARRNHYYYISRYPVGLDATVVKADGGKTTTMSFRNDTANPLVIRGLNGFGWVRFEVYGIPDGRTVSISNPITWGYTAPSDSVVYTSRLAPGVRERVEVPVAGFHASRTRIVHDKNGKVIHRDTWFSHYATIKGVVEVGKGAAPPPAPTDSTGSGDPPGTGG
jgi:vancomycin resistance protein YoaR